MSYCIAFFPSLWTIYAPLSCGGLVNQRWCTRSWSARPAPSAVTPSPSTTPPPRWVTPSQNDRIHWNISKNLKTDQAQITDIYIPAQWLLKLQALKIRREFVVFYSTKRCIITDNKDWSLHHSCLFLSRGNRQSFIFYTVCWFLSKKTVSHSGKAWKPFIRKAEQSYLAWFETGMGMIELYFSVFSPSSGCGQGLGQHSQPGKHP